MSPDPLNSGPMQTDDLIEALAGRLEPVSSRAPLWRLTLWVGGGAVVSAVLMLLWLGPRADFMSAMGTSMFWTKFAYTAALGGLALWLVERMGRPGARVDRPVRMLQSVLVGFVVLAGVRLFTAPMPERHHLIMGHSAMLCPWYILALSVPLLVGLLVALRGFAPTRPTLTGLAAGLAAGGLAAFVYAFSCNESAMPFVAMWYTLPVLAAGVLGAAAGRFALRW